MRCPCKQDFLREGEGPASGKSYFAGKLDAQGWISPLMNDANVPLLQMERRLTKK